MFLDGRLGPRMLNLAHKHLTDDKTLPAAMIQCPKDELDMTDVQRLIDRLSIQPVLLPEGRYAPRDKQYLRGRAGSLKLTWLHLSNSLSRSALSHTPLALSCFLASVTGSGHRPTLTRRWRCSAKWRLTPTSSSGKVVSRTQY